MLEFKYKIFHRKKRKFFVYKLNFKKIKKNLEKAQA